MEFNGSPLKRLYNVHFIIINDFMHNQHQWWIKALEITLWWRVNFCALLHPNGNEKIIHFYVTLSFVSLRFNFYWHFVCNSSILNGFNKLCTGSIAQLLFPFYIIHFEIAHCLQWHTHTYTYTQAIIPVLVPFNR